MLKLEIGEEFEPHWGDSHHAFITSFFGQSCFDKKKIDKTICESQVVSQYHGQWS